LSHSRAMAMAQIKMYEQARKVVKAEPKEDGC